MAGTVGGLGGGGEGEGDIATPGGSGGNVGKGGGDIGGTGGGVGHSGAKHEYRSAPCMASRENGTYPSEHVAASCAVC